MQMKDNGIHIGYRVFGKRLIDLLCSFCALIVLSPFFLIIALLIKMDSKGPVIYRQKRVGKDTQDFYIYKFRTMVTDADKIGPASTRLGDVRITRIGKIMRKLSFDELPQLFNILKGNMSIVGYRPGVRENYTVEELNSKIFSLKPGITGYAQIKGRSLLTREEKRRWEMKYAQDISFLTDVKIVLSTVKNVVSGKAAY